MSSEYYRHVSAARPERVLPLRERAEVRNNWLLKRFDSVLPKLMQREGFDMWIVIAREYNEDPVIMTLLPATMLSARRRTILLFSLQDDGKVERLTLSRYGMGDYYKGVWDPDEEDQWECLRRLVEERDPERIGINTSQEFALADGLSHNEYSMLVDALGEEYAERLAGAERLAIGWLETRHPDEIDAYTGIVELAHDLISKAFSSAVIHPGVTTTDDVVWWFRQRILELGLEAWFQPTVDIQAPGVEWRQEGARKVIMPGDLLHCDVGLQYLGLCTDTQQHAYVLKLGETDAPDGLKAALASGNRLQDILAEEYAEGQSGNQILAASLTRAREEGLTPSIYTHPIGYHGHAAGPTIGLWDQQEGVPGRGDYELFADTCYAMELNIRQAVEEWDGQEVCIALEQDVVFTGGEVYFLAGRQTEFHIVGL